MDNMMSDDEIMANWYRYAAEQSGSADSLLRVLRDRVGQTVQQQQREFGAGDDEFVRLRGFRRPRSDRFAADAQSIAEACNLTNPLAFVRAMILARAIEQRRTTAASRQYYQAAF